MLLAACEQSPRESSTPAPERSYPDRVGTRYDREESQPGLHASFSELKLPHVDGGDAIWGASGRDDRGHIWLGISVNEGVGARLLEYVPDSGRFHDRGDPMTALREAGLDREGQTQLKLHSKIIQADDGNLYFASMDEHGERSDGSRLPAWGSSFWRYKLKENRWEHLFSAPEALIAVTGVGRWVYALGYWDHVLYQYDTLTGNRSKVRVGSEGGHVTRNIVSDERGHVYVPRVRYHDFPGADPLLVTTLVEYDSSLNELASTPLVNYAGEGRLKKQYGLAAFSYLADKSIVILTGAGFLYRIYPADNGPARVESAGQMNTDARNPLSTLFPVDGRNMLLGVRELRDGNIGILLYDLDLQVATASEVFMDPQRRPLMYGSNTRDDQGNYYVVGRARGSGPSVFRFRLQPDSTGMIP